MSPVAADIRPIVVRVFPSAIALCVLACVLAAAAGYGWFGQSPDYSAYLSVYDQLRPHDLLSNYRFERGYMFASWVCKFYLGMEFAQYYTLLAAVSLLLKFRLLWRHTSAPLVAAFVYLVFLYPISEYTQLRAAVAFAFAFTAIDEYLGGRWFSALALLAGAVTFHSSAVVLGGGAVAVLLVRNRTPVFVACFFGLMAAAASLLISAAVHFLQRVNPFVSTYINKAFLNQPPNLFSGQNILLFLLTLSSAIFLRPWQRRDDGFFYYVSFWTLIAYVAFLRIPVFAHRISEAFIFSYFLFAFRFDDFHRSRIPAYLIILTGAWMFYKSIVEGVLLVYNR